MRGGSASGRASAGHVRRLGVGAAMVLCALSTATMAAGAQTRQKGNSPVARIQATVAMDAEAEPITRHAAEEMAKYLRQMNPSVQVDISKGLPRSGQGPVFAVCAGPESMLLKRLDRSLKEGLLPARVRDSGDGFVLRTLRHGRRPLLVLAGASGKGALNACYHYLERVCGVGFFSDGEQVPSLQPFPVAGSAIEEVPRFRYRADLSCNWGVGVRDYYTRMFTLGDWQRYLDWMARKKLNVLQLYIEAVDKFWGDVFAKAFPEVKAHGYPRRDDVRVFAPEYRTQLMKQVYAYARSRGIRVQPVLFWGGVEQTYKMAHPQLEYVKGPYSADTWFIRGDQPECAAAMEKLWRAYFEEFGNDHLYRLDLAMETKPTGKDSRELYREAREVIRRLDPKAEVISHWNYARSPPMSSVSFLESAQDFAKTEGDLTVEDWVEMPVTFPEADKLLSEAGRKKWISIYWNTGWDMDKYIAPYQPLIDTVHLRARDPHFVGMHSAAGDLSSAINLVAADLMCRMAWRPDQVRDAAGFAGDYAWRRHGPRAGGHPQVLASYLKMLDGAAAYQEKRWRAVKGTPDVMAYGGTASNLWTSANFVDAEGSRKAIGLCDEALAALPRYGPVADAPFIADHRFRLTQTRLFMQVEEAYLRALTGDEKAARLAAIGEAIEAAVALRTLLAAHGKRSIADTYRSLRDEGLPVVTQEATKPWGWFGGYDSVESVEEWRLPRLRKLKEQLQKDEKIAMPWAWMTGGQ